MSLGFLLYPLLALIGVEVETQHDESFIKAEVSVNGSGVAEIPASNNLGKTRLSLLVLL